MGDFITTVRNMVFGDNIWVQMILWLISVATIDCIVNKITRKRIESNNPKNAAQNLHRKCNENEKKIDELRQEIRESYYFSQRTGLENNVYYKKFKESISDTMNVIEEMTYFKDKNISNEILLTLYIEVTDTVIEGWEGIARNYDMRVVRNNSTCLISVRDVAVEMLEFCTAQYRYMVNMSNAKLKSVADRLKVLREETGLIEQSVKELNGEESTEIKHLKEKYDNNDLTTFGG